MQLDSPFESMINSASICLPNVNLKLIIRHSVKNDQSLEKDIQLTPNGKMIAYRLGKSLSLPIGFIACSPVLRCCQTCEEIIKGFNDNSHSYQFQPVLTKILQTSHIINSEKSGKLFKTFSIQDIFRHYVECRELDGLHNLSDSVLPILRYVFEKGGVENTVDIFCTHDTQISLILLFIGYDQNEILECWPRMPEGIFLWEEAGHYYAAWRGSVKEFKI